MSGGAIFTIDEAREVLRIDGTDNDAQIMALVEAIPAYLEITAGYTASEKTIKKKVSVEYSPLAKTAARFIRLKPQDFYSRLLEKLNTWS